MGALAMLCGLLLAQAVVVAVLIAVLRVLMPPKSICRD
jgi:hypothetical protein